MTSEQFMPLSRPISILPQGNNDEAYVYIGFKGEEVLSEDGLYVEDKYFGEYVLSRASEEDGYLRWIEMHRFRLQDEKPSTISFRDFTIKQGVKYKYGIS
jgi:hypothetical protein